MLFSYNKSTSFVVYPTGVDRRIRTSTLSCIGCICGLRFLDWEPLAKLRTREILYTYNQSLPWYVLF